MAAGTWLGGACNVFVFVINYNCVRSGDSFGISPHPRPCSYSGFAFVRCGTLLLNVLIYYTNYIRGSRRVVGIHWQLIWIQAGGTRAGNFNLYH